MTSALCAIAGLLVGGLVAWLLAGARAAKQADLKFEGAQRQAGLAEGRSLALESGLAETRARAEALSQELASAREQVARESGARIQAETRLAEAVLRLAEEKALLDEARAKLGDTFKALAGDALHGNTASFMALAKETLDTVLAEARGDLGLRQEAIQGLVQPLKESLAKVEEQARALEKHRQEAYAGLAEQVKGLSAGQQQLHRETANLVSALRKPQVRGRWGEMTLRRVAELSGMAEHCDFSEQVSTDTEAGRLRPDLVVRLPAGREIVVDAKVSLEAYLDALNADTEEGRAQALVRHGAQMRTHMNALAGKQYWSQFPQAPEFVVMFIPGEAFFGAAVDADYKLIEDGLERRVVLATPTTFIALLRAVAYGWRQEQVARNAQEISALGRELYERMGTLAGHLAKVGKGLENANTAYNGAVASLESRVLPTARRFKDLGAAPGDDIALIAPVESAPRALNALEGI